ncbi:protein ANTAGONIST OF LIKE HETEROCHROMATIN PROTEIN 1-like [Osmia bicornis bicornis]|uniref:protein ANTAGONIST OF LIKE HETEROCHROMATIN PROTEIN 1-like n=1 Tax=Osmia bicornis bicornis TaxID=1437191 RepID=UPI001EAF2580|nr:protein ANTAGONIST OF LIKE HETEROCHROMATIN PROTEIN 1-like [Osmia bicornis bicornis]
MSSDQVKVAAASVVYLLSKKRKKQKRKCWVRDWIQRRGELGCYQQLMNELKNEDQNTYKNFLRMSHADFNVLLQKVRLLLQKQNTNMRESISAGERLAVSLRFLATGDSYNSLMYVFRIPATTIAKIIPEVCEAIYTVLKDEYLKMPNTEEEWVQHANEFKKKWNFPNCVGAIDGKHVRIFAPPNSGSSHYNYKGSHSIVLMAVADANYRIIYCDVGCKGRISDGGVFNRCSLSNALERNAINIPPANPLVENGPPVPYVIVADDAFALKSYMMKPYSGYDLSGPQRVYNYRLSRARRIIENVFGIMSTRFRILLTSINLDEKKTTKIVLAISNDFDRETASGDLVLGRWRNEENNEMLPLNRDRPTNPVSNAKNVRHILTDYFVYLGHAAASAVAAVVAPAAEAAVAAAAAAAVAAAAAGAG